MTEVNFEDNRPYGLDAADEEALIRQQKECILGWTTQDGSPMAVVMNYVAHGGRFWLSSSSFRKRVRAISRDPRVVIVISSAGCELGERKTVTYKGEARLHTDAETKAWLYPAMAHRLLDDHEEFMDDWIRMLDSPNRVVIEVVPGLRVSYDGDKKLADTGDPRQPATSESSQ
jgi:nitroimidazol reductase NimA-like FMN-containing flavoprotein (pyridoxamine 5'-phosphate oxidase superfamily)